MLEFLKNFKVMFGSQKILGKEKKMIFLLCLVLLTRKYLKKKSNIIKINLKFIFFLNY